MVLKVVEKFQIGEETYIWGTYNCRILGLLPVMTF